MRFSDRSHQGALRLDDVTLVAIVDGNWTAQLDANGRGEGRHGKVLFDRQVQERIGDGSDLGQAQIVPSPLNSVLRGKYIGMPG